MEEFIFGTLATDQLKLMHHRASHSGLQHQHEMYPRNPKPGQPVTLTVHIGVNLAADQVACYFTTDGTQPAGSRGVAVNGAVMAFVADGVVWDTVSWGYRSRWRAVLPAQAAGIIVRYQIGAWEGEGLEVFADWPQVKAASEMAAGAFFRGEEVVQVTIGDPHVPHTFVYSVDDFTAPEWSRKAVIYHIFVDRFYPGDGLEWLQTSDLNGFYGGTLWGMAAKLDYITDLGATCIWLSPTFPSPTHHGYDVTDYYHVEPRLGGDEALHALIEAAHARGIRVLLDVAFNHLSDQHPYFQDALINPASPYRDWFTFDESPVGYRAFFGVPTMPRLNTETPAARAWLLDIGRYWLTEFDVDGYRLDVADGPGPDFWADFQVACKAVKPDCLIFAEVVDAPDVQREYIGRMDGLLDFHLCDALRRTYGSGSWSDADFERFFERHSAYFSDDLLMLSFFDNHDMDRFLLVAGGDKKALRRVAEAQMHLPRVPVIFYGTEVGLSQSVSGRAGMGMHVSRTPMIWGDEQDADLLMFYKQIIKNRFNS